MALEAVLLFLIVVGGTIVLSWPLCRYLKWATHPERPDAGWAVRFNRLFRAIGGGATGADQDWKRYVFALLAFNVVIFVVGFLCLAFQQLLPLNPDGKGAIEASLI